MSAHSKKLRTSIALSLALVGGAGCFESSPVTADAAVDLGPAGDGGHVDSGGGGASCGGGLGAIRVRMEVLTTTPEVCNALGFDAMLMGVEPVPLEDGVRLHLDACPLADAECRCDIIIRGIGVDLASLAAFAPTDVHVRHGAGSVLVERTALCRCIGCECALPLLLYAADGYPNAASNPPTGIAFASLAETCTSPEPGGCASSRHPISMQWRDYSTTELARADEGETAPLGTSGAVLRAIRTTNISCGSEPAPGPNAAWVAWHVAGAVPPGI